ncbi:MAG: class I SAM-dependent rRNA methyltransferase [Candidatus Saccharicenans sp.]|nr:MAG: class I SAM-dependent rRNA methyltransferase [Candidatus Aminicenantes bacterium]HEK84991.1 class I SAM-dependent rRNA methyltransferase [Candidatus Aminicenantes bacterium]
MQTPKNRPTAESREAVVLKPGREQSVLKRHHWLFSGAIQSYPGNMTDGQIYPVFSSSGQLLGQAYFNRRCSLAGRLISFGRQDPLLAIKNNLVTAARARDKLYPRAESVRLVNGESDHLPGLIVDRYGPGLVIQISTLGMEKLKPFLLDQLMALFQPQFIYEKSNSPSRREEGLEETEKLISGYLPEPIQIDENDIKFKIYLRQSQKTGFFLDQREMRQLVRQLAPGLKVLDGFSYTGGFALAALKGGAVRADLVDYSGSALQTAKENLILNGYSENSFRLIEGDMFDFLEKTKRLDYDLVILDPPAFAKKKADQKPAIKAYRELNRLALSKMPNGSFLLTFSCSYYISPELFQKIIFQAALEAGREAKIIQRHRQAFDHLVSIFHPESDYLKGFLLMIN